MRLEHESCISKKHRELALWVKFSSYCSIKTPEPSQEPHEKEFLSNMQLLINAWENPENKQEFSVT